MIKTIKTMSKQEKERYTVPRKVQDVIPVRRCLLYTSPSPRDCS